MTHQFSRTQQLHTIFFPITIQFTIRCVIVIGELNIQTRDVSRVCIRYVSFQNAVSHLLRNVIDWQCTNDTPKVYFELPIDYAIDANDKYLWAAVTI